MDPSSREPEGRPDEHLGERTDGRDTPRPARDPLTPDIGQQTSPRARTVRLVAGDLAADRQPRRRQ